MTLSRRPAYGSVTASAGTIAFTLESRRGMIKQILLKATTSTTTFDVKLTDSNGRDIYTTTDETGILNELIDLPTFAALTVTIENASVDEVFTYHFALEE